MQGKQVPFRSILEIPGSILKLVLDSIKNYVNLYYNSSKSRCSKLGLKLNVSLMLVQLPVIILLGLLIIGHKKPVSVGAV
jgi:hypothetical protein